MTRLKLSNEYTQTVMGAADRALAPRVMRGAREVWLALSVPDAWQLLALLQTSASFPDVVESLRDALETSK